MSGLCSLSDVPEGSWLLVVVYEKSYLIGNLPA